VETVLFTLDKGAQHGRRDPLGHQVGLTEVLVVVGQQNPVGLFQLRDEAIARCQALVVELGVVAGDPQRLQHAQAAEHLGALQHDLQHGAAEKQVDVDRLEIPGMGQEQPAGDDDDRQQDAGDFQYFFQNSHGDSPDRVRFTYMVAGGHGDQTMREV
jgi:hypothetical protein